MEYAVLGGGEDHGVCRLGTDGLTGVPRGVRRGWDRPGVGADHRGRVCPGHPSGSSELGVNFFDVAPAYGQGTAEAVLGRALQGVRNRSSLPQKVRLAAEMHDIAGAVRTSVEASLRRLRREAVDVLHIHNRFTPRRGDRPHALSADDALGPVLDAYQMQHTGKTRFIGISAMEPDVLTVRRICTAGTSIRYWLLQSAQLDREERRRLACRCGTTARSSRWPPLSISA